MMKIFASVLIPITIVILSCKKDKNICPNKVQDNEGNTYNVIQIGNQCWTKENLRTSKFNNGTKITNLIDNWSSSAPASTPAWCNYNNNTTYDATFGKLYNWYTVEAGNICPTGWHVPTDEDWTILTNYLGGESTAGGKMKTITWYPPNTGASNESNFSGLPAGIRYLNSSLEIGRLGRWWSSTETSAISARYLSIGTDSVSVKRSGTDKRLGFSIRCLKD
jgi:uncharacterized protein (TIGR02145 family)